MSHIVLKKKMKAYICDPPLEICVLIREEKGLRLSAADRLGKSRTCCRHLSGLLTIRKKISPLVKTQQ